MKINNTGLGEKMELVTELKTRDDYMNFCLENGAVGGCAKTKTCLLYTSPSPRDRS